MSKDKASKKGDKAKASRNDDEVPDLLGKPQRTPPQVVDVPSTKKDAAKPPVPKSSQSSPASNPVGASKGSPSTGKDSGSAPAAASVPSKQTPPVANGNGSTKSKDPLLAGPVVREPLPDLNKRPKGSGSKADNAKLANVASGKIIKDRRTPVPRVKDASKSQDDIPDILGANAKKAAPGIKSGAASKAGQHKKSESAVPGFARGPDKKGMPAPPRILDGDNAGKDPLSGTTRGATPEPDTKRLQRTMERSGAFRSQAQQKTPRQLAAEKKAADKKAKRFQERYDDLMDAVSKAADELGYAEGRPVTPIPEIPDGHREVEMIPVIPERAYVRILFHEESNSHVYQVIEPELTDTEEEILFFLRDTLIRTLDGRKKGKDGETILLNAVRQAIVDHRILVDEVGARRIEYYLIRDFLGFGPVDILMRDPMIEDISCDGPEIPIYLFHRQYESVRTSVIFDDDSILDSYVIRLAQRSGKHISIADPILDATLPDGSRLQATLSREVTTRGSSFTIRKFKGDPLTPPDLIRYNTMSAEMAAYFWFAMEHGNSFILAGGTASGKTTSLNAICQFIPPEKKIVSIEDTREINLDHENWIAGVTRSGFGGEYIGGKPAGTIDMYKLLEAALRQRPEYLLVGEVRGAEALTLFQAMATGHAVYSTMHADSATSAVYRLENPPINVPRMMLQTLDIVLIQTQVRVGDRMARRLREIMEIVGFEAETKELLTNTVFEWSVDGDRHEFLGKSYILEHIMVAKNINEEQIMAEWKQRIEVLEWMVESGMRHYAEVSSAISSYYHDPERFMARIRAGAKPALSQTVEATHGAS